MDQEKATSVLDQERNQGNPSKPNLNFLAVHKSYSSIFVSNIPWKATVQDLWDSCNQWGAVIDVYIAAKRSKSGHRFGFVRFKNVNDINQLVSNLKVAWMGGFHLFADVAKYGQTNNRFEERSGDNKPNEGVLGDNDASNSGEKHVGVSVSNKANEESSDEALMFISEDDCRRLGWGRWVWLEFNSTDQVESVKNSKVYKKLGGRWGCNVFTDMVNDGPLSHGKVCVLTESLHCVLESFKVLYRNRSYCITATEFSYWAPNIESTEDKSMTDSLERKDDEGPSLDGGPEHEEPLDVDNCDSVSSKYDNKDSDSSNEMSSTSRLMREVDVRVVDSDHVDSFEEGEIIGDSVLNNDWYVKDCMEKNLDDDVDKYIEDCSKNVSEKCEVVNNNMSNNVKGEILEDKFKGDRRNNTIEDNADVNPSTNVYLDVNQNTSILEVVTLN
nr:DUF4283 domain protein [Tanacetum cinerariifolium]